MLTHIAKRCAPTTLILYVIAVLQLLGIADLHAQPGLDSRPVNSLCVAPERPPVENWITMPGQCFSSPSFRRANFSGSLDGV